MRGLESEAEGLGAACYWTLIRALYRVMRIYDHSDAQAYQENLIEYAEADDPANRDQYEFPDVEKALPECIRRSLKNESGHWRLDYRRLLSRHRSGPFQSWIRHIEAIAKLSRVRARSLQGVDFDGYYDGPPLPALLIAFEEHDAIAACFDEESQHMLEGSSENQPSMSCSPPTIRTMSSRQCAALSDSCTSIEGLCELIEEIQSWEARNEGRGFDRGDASLRTA